MGDEGARILAKALQLNSKLRYVAQTLFLHKFGTTLKLSTHEPLAQETG